MKKFAIPFLTAFIAVALLTVPALAQPEAAAIPLPAGTASPRDWTKHAPEGTLLKTAIKAYSAILMDDKTGKVLFEKNADEKLYPASITKIMTCLLALESVENGRKLSELVTIGNLPKLEKGYVSMDLKKGETLTLKDLLYGLMLPSANDAANAIAMHISEEHSIESFAKMMNAKAAELGMTKTHFTNPDGKHDAEHYTTAKDMAILARAARKYPTFVNIVSTTKYTIAATNKTKTARVLLGHNKLISTDKKEAFGYVYATGIKTGFTDAAKRTLVSSAKKDSMYLIGVTMRSNKDEDWVDSITMFEYGFNFYDTLDLKQLLGEQTIKLQVKNSAGSDPGKGELDLLFLPRTPTADTAEPFITDRKEVIEQLKNDLTQFEMKKEITKDTAPIAKDDVVGKVTFLYEGKPVLEYDLMASRDIKEMPTPAPTVSVAASPGSGIQATGVAPAPGSTVTPGTNSGGAVTVFIWLGSILLLLLIAMLAIRFINMRRRNHKYRQYNYRQGSNSTRNR